MVVLLLLIAIVLAAPYVYQWYRKDKTINVTEFNNAYAALEKANPRFSNDLQSPKNDLFKFNPNSISTSGWQRLGLTARQAAIIKITRLKGAVSARRKICKRSTD